MVRIVVGVVVLCATAAGCEELEPPPPTPSGSIVVPYQFNLEFSIEQEAGQDHTARARLYDIAQAYDWAGNAGTIELTDGDAVFADDVQLDIETRTQFLNTLRVDYSQTVPAGGDEAVFELRRPDDERIEATIGAPDPFEIDDIGDIDFTAPWAELTWSPVVEGATVDLKIRPLDDGCLTVIGGEAGDIVLGLDDTGEYRFDTDVYHSIDHDCAYELIFARRFVKAVPARWHVEGQDLPANDVWAIGVHTVRKSFVALQR